MVAILSTMLSGTAILILLAALPLEAITGYPKATFRAIGHPVTWMGATIAALETRFNDSNLSEERRRANGVLALATLVAASAGAAWAAQTVLMAALPGILVIALLAIAASTLIAQRSLDEHVRAVADALETEGLPGGRRAVAMIVGRDPDSLDDAGIARAAIESLAENFSDGVVAPAFWLAALGLPGMAAYKAINTADSMVGHRNARYRAYGRATARLDDLVNLPASRLSALWIAGAAAIHPGADARAALRTAWNDARKHRSPNAGWPEAAMAGALGLSLAGPRRYGDEVVADAFMGEGRRDAAATDIRRALTLYRTACAVQFAAVAGVAALIWLWR